MNVVTQNESMQVLVLMESFRYHFNILIRLELHVSADWDWLFASLLPCLGYGLTDDDLE